MSDLHPDDEALSAHLDGEEPQVRVHVESCTACTARLAELRRVRAAVGAPVTPPPAWQRDATIARALEAVGRAGGARRAHAGGIAAAILLVLGAAVGLSQLSHSAGTVRESAQTGRQFGTGDSAGRRCVDAARALDPANVSPAAAGTATWQGTPAEVLVYAVAGRPGAARVYVLAQADCRVLEFQSYAP